MPITFGEQILSGVVLALGGGLVGRISGISTFNKICKERQSACTTHMCSEITDIKETQKTIQDDIKKLLQRG
jgi:hypothetical protein